MEDLLEAVNQELPEAQRREVYQTLLKVLRNIVNNPAEPKYRTLKKDNKLVAEKLCRCPAVLTLLLALGFQDEGAAYQCPASAGTELLSEVADMVECLLASTSEAVPAAGAAGASGPAAAVAAATAASALPRPAAASKAVSSGSNFSRRPESEKQREEQAAQLEAIRAAHKIQHTESSRSVTSATSASGAASGGSPAAATPSATPKAEASPADLKKKTPKSAFDFESRSRKEQEQQKANASLEELRRQQREKFEEFKTDPDAKQSEAYKRPPSVANGGKADQGWGDWLSGFFGGGGSSSSGGGGGGRPSNDRRGPNIKGVGDLPKPVRRG